MKLRTFLFCSVVFSIVAVATILYVTGTGDTPQSANTSKPQASDEPHPSGADIEKALVPKLPTFTRVSSLSVVSILTGETNQNLGTNVVWQARIRVTITVTTDTFTLENEDSEVIFVRPVKRSGESIEVFGNCVSELYAGAWRTTVELEGQPIETPGKPLSDFGPKKVIVRGSKDEKQYFADKQAEKQNAEMLAEIKNAKTKILEGTLSDYICGHACYLTITDKKGRKHTDFCFTKLCDAWWTGPEAFLPARYKGKRVRVTVVKERVELDNGAGPFAADVIRKIQFLK